MKKPSRKRILAVSAALVLLAWLCCLPRTLFRDVPYSTVVEDRDGNLLGARIATDGQWRFPPRDTVPEKFATALIQFEDRYFRWHPGINPIAIGRALIGNIRAGHVTSGGSTLTMQVIRLSRGKERTLWQKAIEAVQATRLEARCSKDEILALYAAHAPFGGNVVGLEAAAWRYFGRPADELSWGEAATLAVLPNAPASIHPGKAREQLLAKRNRLLDKLLKRGYLDSLDHELACSEPLPQAPKALPAHAPHWVEIQPKGVRSRTSVSLSLQDRVEAITDRWSRELDRSGIADLSAIVLDNRTGEVLAYVGNADPLRERPGRQVDIAHSPRSTGSILKPFLYCALLQEGQILPRTLLPDIPVNIGGFSPQNFDLQFYGAVPADNALARSLNVPAVHMLRRYGVPKFHQLLREAGLMTLTREPADYGLSLILGGGEGTLMDITRAYASMARSYLYDTGGPLHDKVALWHTFEALSEVNRPDEIDWHLVRSIRKTAWKTGTSYGFRDAWAVGVTPDYTVGVWAGNAAGQGVPGLTGARTAGPVLFELFGLLPVQAADSPYAEGAWFAEPFASDGIRAETCKDSGHLKGMYCAQTDTLLLPKAALESEACPYHQPDGSFLLPPAMEWYYRQHHPEYQPTVRGEQAVMEFIYPEPGSTIWLPRQLDGQVKGAVFQLAHRDPSATVFWHMDGEFLGQTRFLHQLSLQPDPGDHALTVVDGEGRTLSVRFRIAENGQKDE